MAALTGIVVSKQLNVLTPTLFDAPYTVPAIYSRTVLNPGVTGVFQLAKGSKYPLTFSGLVNSAATPKYFVRMNAALLRSQAATLYKGGDQTPVYEVSSGYYTWYDPCFYKNTIAWSLNCSGALTAINPCLTYVDSMPEGVGHIGSPIVTLYTPIGNGQALTQFGQMYGVTGTCRFSDGLIRYAQIIQQAGGGSARMFGYGPNGYTTSGFLPIISQIGNWWSYVKTFGFYEGIGNVFICMPNAASKLTLVICDSSFNQIVSYQVQLDSANYNTQLQGAQATSFLGTIIQATAGGFLITGETIGAAANFVSYGTTRNYFQFLLSPDGSYWAPIVARGISAGAQTINTFSNWGGLYTQDYHLDPEGVFWYCNFSGGILNVYNSFGVSISQPIVPPWLDYKLPGFGLSCYTPCDTVVTTHPGD